MRLTQTCHFLAAFTFVASGLLGIAEDPPQFPQVQVRPLTLLGVWESAQTVVVGQLRNGRPAGTQKVKQLPWPAPPSVDVIYWCIADLDIGVIVKGQRPTPGKVFLWGTAKPDCTLYASQGGRPITRVWFIREEGKYIRPVVDGFGIYYVNFYVPWDQDPLRDQQQQFGELLLDPAAHGGNLAEFALGFDAPASTACFVLGRVGCIERIRNLARLGEPDLQRAACGFLKSEFQVPCGQ